MNPISSFFENCRFSEVSVMTLTLSLESRTAQQQDKVEAGEWGSKHSRLPFTAGSPGPSGGFQGAGGGGLLLLPAGGRHPEFAKAQVYSQVFLSKYKLIKAFYLTCCFFS